MDLTGPGLFGVQSIDYTALLPVLLVAAGALAVLVADLFLTEKRKPWLAWATIGVLVAALIAETILWSTNTVLPRNTFCMPSGAPGGAACSYSVDNFTLTLQTLVLAATVLVVLMAPRRFQVPFGEYHFLVLCSLTGAMVLVAARDFVTITVALETLSLPAFALVGFGRPAGGEAALKFFLMSIASTAVMLFGISLIYGVTDTVFFQLTSSPLARIEAQGGPQAAVAATGMVLTLVGFAFKISAVPFHFWTPEVYAGAPVPVAAYLSVVSKAAGFAGLILTVEHAFRAYVHSIGVLIAVLAAVTMTVGNVIALRQRSAVRLLAWSTVAQAGYILVPLAVTRGTTDPVAASVSYLVLYGVMNLGAFGVVSALFADPSTYPALAATQPPAPTLTEPSALGPAERSALGPAQPSATPAQPSTAPAQPSATRAPAQSSVVPAQPSAPRVSASIQPSGTGAPASTEPPATGAPVQPSAGPSKPSATHAPAQPPSIPVKPSGTRAPAQLSAVPPATPPSGGELAAYRGMYREHPRAAVALAFFLLCLAGLPPGVMGLFAKVVVFKAAVSGDLVWLAVVMAINVVVALYYYLRWAAVLFDVSLFGASLPGAPLPATPITAPPLSAAPPSGAALPGAGLPGAATSGATLSEETEAAEPAAPDSAPVPALPRAVPALAPRIAIGIAFALAVVFSFWPNPALDAITFR